MKTGQIDNLLGAVALVIHDRMTSDFGELGLHTATDAATLIVLLQFGHSSIGSLAEILQLSHSSAVRVADRLEMKGLVSRLRHDGDARSVRLALTATGHALATAALGARERSLRALSSALSTDELRQFGRLLTKVLVQATTGRKAADRLCRLCDEGVCTRKACPVEQRALQLSAKSA